MPDSKIILLTGPRFCGKSLFVENLLPVLLENGLSVTGFFQRGVFDGGGDKAGYDLVSVQNAESVPLAHRASPNSPWEFNEQAFDRAAEMIEDGADVIILDEIGPLELSGGGHAKTLQNALVAQSALVIVVREELALELKQSLPPRCEVAVIRFEPGNEEKLSRRILELLLP
jgi:nucleoside-triphosphatase THEP1